MVDVDVDRYFGCFRGASKVSSGTVQYYRSSYGSDFDNSSPVRKKGVCNIWEMHTTILAPFCSCSRTMVPEYSPTVDGMNPA